MEQIFPSFVTNPVKCKNKSALVTSAESQELHETWPDYIQIVETIFKTNDSSKRGNKAESRMTILNRMKQVQMLEARQMLGQKFYFALCSV